MSKSFILSDYLNKAKYIPSKPGVYYILLPKNRSIKSLRFINKINSHNKLRVKDKNGPYSIKKLKEKQRLCEENKGYKNDLLYIGKAKNLNNRINEYINYLFCGGKVHKGGRVIGQIVNFEELICRYSKTSTEEKAIKKETYELQTFKKKRKCLPLANWRK